MSCYNSNHQQLIYGRFHVRRRPQARSRPPSPTLIFLRPWVEAPRSQAREFEAIALAALKTIGETDARLIAFSRRVVTRGNNAVFAVGAMVPSTGTGCTIRGGDRVSGE